jgi:hypothetical protein
MVEAALSAPHQVSANKRCLLAAIKFAAVTAMSDGDCWIALNASRQTSLEFFRAHVQEALNRADFLVSHDFITLQAFVIFLVSNRRHQKQQAMWILSGVAIRLAQSIGVRLIVLILSCCFFYES